MRIVIVFIITVMALILPVQAATITNSDTAAQMIVVAENGQLRDITLKTGQWADICPQGCFITLPNGDRFALEGTETLTIANGKAKFD